MLDDLVERVSRIAEDMFSDGRESFAHDMFEVERSLRSAQRRLSAVSRQTKTSG